MAIHTREDFLTIVAALNKTFEGFLIFQLAGSLTEKPASFHDADIIVYPQLPIPIPLDSFAKGLASGGTHIVEVDRSSTTPFPGRPNGQDRIQIKFSSGEVVDLFLPKGSLK